MEMSLGLCGNGVKAETFVEIILWKVYGILWKSQITLKHGSDTEISWNFCRTSHSRRGDRAIQYNMYSKLVIMYSGEGCRTHVKRAVDQYYHHG